MTPTDIVFLLLWVIVPFMWFYTLKLGGMSAMALSLPSFLVIFIVIFQYIGFPILYFSIDEYRAEFVTNQNLILKAWAITSITTFFLCIGAVLGALFFGPLKYFRIHGCDRDLLPHYCIRRIYLIGFICITVLYTYISKIGFYNIALVLAIGGASQFEVILARSMMGNDFGSGYHWYNFFMRDALIFLSSVFIAMRLQGIIRVSMAVIIASFVVVTFSLVMATEKGLFVDYLITLALLFIISRRRGVASFSGVFYLSIPIFIALIIFYIFFMGDSNFVAAISSIISRGLTGSLQPIYHYLEFFPEYQDWLYGASFPNPGGILPFTSFSLNTEVMCFVEPKICDAGIVGTMPAIYWGEMYANFGYFGLVVAAPLIGFSLYFINWIVFKLYLDPLNTALFAWLLMHYKNLSVTALSTFFFDLNLYLIIIIYLFIRVRLRLSKKADNSWS